MRFSSLSGVAPRFVRRGLADFVAESEDPVEA
jgi:hypothetical protein